MHSVKVCQKVGLAANCRHFILMKYTTQVFVKFNVNVSRQQLHFAVMVVYVICFQTLDMHM